MEPADTDDVLMQRIARKDGAAYRALLGRHLNFCVRFAERMTGSRADAEDIAQNVSLKIWREAEKWQPEAHFRTWLYRVVLNASLDHKRKVVAFAPLDDEQKDDTPQPHDVLSAAQTAARVKQALAQLPERQRAAVVMSYYEGLGNAESAEAMNIELGAFQQLLFRARQNLKQELMMDVQELKNG